MPALLHAANGYTVLQGNIMAQTDKAILFAILQETANSYKEHWFPRSRTGYIYHSKPDDDFGHDVIHVETWLITKNKIEYLEV